MSDTCTHMVPHAYTRLQAYQYDPTRTLTLRNAFVRAVRKRFKELSAMVYKTIVTDDCFGLQVGAYSNLNSPGRQAFNFPRTSQKVEAFMQWLRRQEDLGLLQVGQFERIGESVEGAWTNLYIMDSYKRGVQRARAEMKKAGYDVPTVEASGGITAIMGTPFHIDRVGLLFTRAFEELRGITAQMDTVISQVLGQGMVDGDGALYLARKLVSVIDGAGAGKLGLDISYINRFGTEVKYYMPARQRAEIMARTEVIRAHHAANIQEYMNWRVLGVTVIAELVTAGDERVCDQCAGYHGNRYTLEEAQYMIPVHPQCRCVVIPVNQVKKGEE